MLFILGIMATINQEIDYDTCSLIAADYGIELELNIAKTAEDVLNESVEEADSEENLVPPPAGSYHNGPREPRQDLAA